MKISLLWVPIIILGVTSSVMPKVAAAPNNILARGASQFEAAKLTTASTSTESATPATPATPAATTPAASDVSATHTVASSSTPIQSIEPNSASNTSFDNAVRQWITVLAMEKGFENWKEAQWESIPLGPGTHSWVVILKKKQLEVGYLLISATEDGERYSLTEYGTGSKPLFSLQTLYRSLIQFELINSHISFESFLVDPKINKKAVYTGTLQSYWKVMVGTVAYYLDAKSGGKLPSLNKSLSSPVNPSFSDKVAFAKHQTPIIDSMLTDSFDPMDKPVWIKGTALVISKFGDLLSVLDIHDTQLTYTAKLYDNQVIYPFAIVGYQLWGGGKAYIALDHENPRYIPFSSMLSIGHFYR